MDKNWIDLPTRTSREYFNGVDGFLEFAYTGRPEGSLISCPCRRCENRYSFSREVVTDHLYCNGFLKKYENWTNHGEAYVPLHVNQENETSMDLDSGDDDMLGMLNDALGNPHVVTRIEGDEQTTNDPQIGPNEESAKYYKLLRVNCFQAV